jgi:hypothetical protein
MEIPMENGEGIVHQGDGLEEFNRIRAMHRALAQAPLVDGHYVVEVDPPTRDWLLRDLEAQSLELVQMALDEGVRTGAFVRLPNGNYVPAN